jgi:hypothetical protein
MAHNIDFCDLVLELAACGQSKTDLLSVIGRYGNKDSSGRIVTPFSKPFITKLLNAQILKSD